GNDLTKLNEYGLPQLVGQGRNFPFIMAAPQCPEGKFWSTDNWLDSLYADLTTRYRVDPKRIYLTGISMGGYGTWQTAVDHPDKFAAIMPLCGGCDDSTQICRIKHLPVWAFHGTADDVITINETERLVKRLSRCGSTVKFTRLENVGHRIQYLYEDSALYDWLLKQHK
ncbi:MAG: prolyl oligopeptidase family serine peptidase, partial [Bacteroidetes bacterium]|nr:prolyl oligopeptidase family serine peptidase [Fibrella sp.]